MQCAAWGTSGSYRSRVTTCARSSSIPVLLLAGLALSQFLSDLLGEKYASAALVIRALTMTGLAFIMIHVGFEFHIDKTQLRKYGWDYVIAFTAATFPWVFVTLYFVLVMLTGVFIVIVNRLITGVPEKPAVSA